MRRSTNTTATQVKIGLFVSVCLVLLAGGILSIGQYDNLFRATKEISLTLPHAGGLRAGSPVRLAGIEVGVVEELALLDAPKASGVRLTLAIEESVFQRLRADVSAVLRRPGVFGEQYVEIDPGDKAQAWQPTHQPLEGTIATPPADKFFSRAETAVDSFQTILADLQAGQGSVGRLTRDPALYNNLVRLTGELNQIVESLNASRGTMGLLLRSETVHEQLTSVLQRAGALLEQLQSTQGTAGKLVSDSSLHDQTVELFQKLERAGGQVETVLTKLDQADGTAGKFLNDARLYQEGVAAFEQFRTASQRLDRLLAGLENGTGTAGLLLADAALYQNFNLLLSNVNRLVQDIRRNPDRYLTIEIF